MEFPENEKEGIQTMRKTKALLIADIDDTQILVSMERLAQLCDCGYTSACKIAEAAEARYSIGRRVLVDYNKVKDYISGSTY